MHIRQWKHVMVVLILMIPIISLISFHVKAKEPGTGWDVFDTKSSEIQVSPGEYFYFTFNTQSHELEFHKIPDITSKAQQAVGLVPAWMRANLSYKFRQLSDSDQNIYADLIINSPDPKYRDEIGFVIAHSSMEVLTHTYFFPSLLTFNAQLIYQNDQYLEYVEVVDEADHTTLHYHDRDNNTIVLDKEYYYWFIVHPKVSDEIPTYVDPNYNYVTMNPRNRNYGVAPPTGKFWRDWLFYENKSGQPLLKEKLQGKYTYYDAIGAINSWVSASMRFTSDNERPVQPVRIYQKGIGRCGEHQDIRAAAARAALIPTVCTLNPAEDHVWNEYFDGRWIHWDGGRENPLMYEKNWGKKISTVWSWRGDGLTWSVIERYSTGYSNFSGSVKDASGYPVEGADVMIATENYYDPQYLTITHWTTTAPDGSLLTTVGDQRNFWAQADGGDLGKQPAGDSVVSVITDSVDGTNYNKDFQLPKSSPRLKYSEDTAPEDPENRYRVHIDLEVESSLVHGANLFTGERFDKYFDYGYVDFFWTDVPNFNLYEGSNPFQGYDLNERVGSLKLDFLLPKENVYHGVISNEFSDLAMKTVNITVTVESFLDLEILEPFDDTKYTLGSQIIVQGTSFSPWGIDSVDLNFLGNTSSFEVDDISYAKDPPFTNWMEVIDTMDLGPGAHTIQITAIDGDREILREVSIEIEDLQAPVLVIEDPDDNERFRKDQILNISGTCSDDHLVQVLSYYLDGDSGSKVDITDNIIKVSWTLELDLDDLNDGIHEISFTAVDPSGNMAITNLEFEVLEIDAPLLRIISPSQDSIVREGMVTIEGEISDVSGIRSFKVSFDGGDWENIRSAINEDDLFSYELNAYGIRNGTHTLRFFAEDRVDNFVEETLHITIDGIEPTVSIPMELRNPVMKKGGGFLLEGYINDTSGISSLKLILQTGSAGEYDLMPYLNGNHLYGMISTDDISHLNSPHLEIVATDIVGLSDSLTIELTIDEFSPSGELLPLDPVLIGDSYSIDFQISDDTWFNSVLLTLHDGTEMNITEDFSSFGWNTREIGTEGAQPGSHIISLEAVDVVGNVISANAQVFFYDLTSDHDGDGMSDQWEIEHHLDHLSDDSDGDPDNDGFTNIEEYLGNDKEPGGDDGSDPQKIGSYPIYPSSSSESNALLILIMAGIILIIILIIAMMSVLLIRSKRTAASQVPFPPNQSGMPPVPQRTPIPPAPQHLQLQPKSGSVEPRLLPPGQTNQ